MLIKSALGSMVTILVVFVLLPALTSSLGTSQSQAADGKSSVKRKEAPNMQHHASKDTRKCAAAKRQDEVSSILAPSAYGVHNLTLRLRSRSS